jgi:hypothetical protein
MGTYLKLFPSLSNEINNTVLLLLKNYRYWYVVNVEIYSTGTKNYQELFAFGSEAIGSRIRKNPGCKKG